MLQDANQLASSMGLDLDFTFFFIAAGLMMTRIIVVLSLTPYLGMKPVAANIRVATTIALTVFIYPWVMQGIDRTQIPQGATMLLALFLKEVLFGVMMGLVNLMILFGIQSAGSMIDNQRSVANARIFNPSLGAQASIFGIYFYQLTIAIFLALGFHRPFIKALVESFQKVPLLSFPTLKPGITPLIDFLLRLSGETLIICLQVSAPVLIAIFVADLVLGITNRIAPMINVFEMGFNVKGFVGALLVYLSLPIFLTQSRFWFHKMIEYFGQVSDLFI